MSCNAWVLRVVVVVVVCCGGAAAGASAGAGGDGGEPQMAVLDGKVHVWGDDIVLHAVEASKEVNASGLADAITSLAASAQAAKENAAEDSSLVSEISSRVSTLTNNVTTLSSEQSEQVSSLSTMMAADVSHHLSTLESTLKSSFSTHMSSAVSSLEMTLRSDISGTASGIQEASEQDRDSVLRTALNRSDAISTRLSMAEEEIGILIETILGENQTLLVNYTSDIQELRRDVLDLNNDHHKYEMAQAACTAMNGNSGWTYAVRRRCSDDAPTCGEICAYDGLRQQDGQVEDRNLECFDALHVYYRLQAEERPTTDIETHKLTYKVHKYNSCTGRHCGPNFCCCRTT